MVGTDPFVCCPSRFRLCVTDTSQKEKRRQQLAIVSIRRWCSFDGGNGHSATSSRPYKTVVCHTSLEIFLFHFTQSHLPCLNLVFESHPPPDFYEYFIRDWPFDRSKESYVQRISTLSPIHISVHRTPRLQTRSANDQNIVCMNQNEGYKAVHIDDKMQTHLSPANHLQPTCAQQLEMCDVYWDDYYCRRSLSNRCWNIVYSRWLHTDECVEFQTHHVCPNYHRIGLRKTANRICDACRGGH